MTWIVGFRQLKVNVATRKFAGNERTHAWNQWSDCLRHRARLHRHDRRLWANEPFAYLTTIGRRTGAPHRIEIWFAIDDGALYLLSCGRNRSDWVLNLQANPNESVGLGAESLTGVAQSHGIGRSVSDSRRDPSSSYLSGWS